MELKELKAAASPPSGVDGEGELRGEMSKAADQLAAEKAQVHIYM